ncbi:hypothetical protein [Erythrobacter sp.]|uniref:hypothetical protein n=1 Tax=Erythrobacter sp. TaxID=1042 RepID=UPI0025F8D242|nr:hypothetical protein [Erythrobacter sp.]
MRYFSYMGSETRGRQEEYVGQLATHASMLQREAHSALKRGDYERAAALIDDAALLADDVGAMVDAIEERRNSEMMMLVAEHHAASGRRRKPVFGPRSRKLGAVLGTGLAISLALVEC